MSVLLEILQHKREELKKAQRSRPICELLSAARGLSACRPLRQKLRSSANIAIIAEVKKASPSAGIIREPFELESIVKTYSENGATAISILTDQNFFQGKLEYLEQARELVDLPLLRKDFLIDPYQVVEARVCGADAVLLIVAALAKDQNQELVAAAREYGLEYLVEVHNFKELEFALQEGFDLIGINNRDLSSFAVELRTTEKLSQICPPEVTIVSESGIRERSDIERLSTAGIDAVLVGESLMRKENIAEALQVLTGVPKCRV